MIEEQEVAITELEIITLYMRVSLWNELLKRRHVLFCLDNEVTRFGMIKGYSHPSMVSRFVNALCIQFEASLILLWFLRVPSAANISDFLSRSLEYPCLKSDFTLKDAHV